MSWLSKRLKEPSSWSGLGAIIMGVGIATNQPELIEVANEVGGASVQVEQGVPWFSVLVGTVMSVAGFGLAEKGN